MNIKKYLKITTLIIVVLVLCVFGLFCLVVWDENRQSRGNDIEHINYGEYTKYVDIYDVVKEAYLANNGYTNEISKYMVEDVFKRTNYKHYENDPQYTKPLKVDFSLKEVYQTKDKENNLIYVDMIYTIVITDANGAMVRGSWKNHSTFTVKITDNGWIIIDKYEKP